MPCAFGHGFEVGYDLGELDDGTGFRGRVDLLVAAYVGVVSEGISSKRAKKRETPGERAQHLIPVLVGCWLLFGRKPHWGWLNLQVLPQKPSVWMMGLMLTAVGVGIGIWARLSLGTNWSGMVTLKSGHQLIRHRPYRWIRHPIYAGILGGRVGTAIMIGDLRVGSAWSP